MLMIYCSMSQIMFSPYHQFYLLLRDLVHSLAIEGSRDVSRTLNALFAVNFLPLMSKIKQDLERLGSVPLSLTRIISAVKMNILPKFLFLFYAFHFSCERIFSKQPIKLFWTSSGAKRHLGSSNPHFRNAVLHLIIATNAMLPPAN